MFNYKFSNLCGSPYKQGNLQFSPSDDVLYSPIGNRITKFDLKNNISSTLAFQARKNIRCLALDPLVGKIMVIVDVDGRAMITNVETEKVLHYINFKKKVKSITFSPCSQFLAVSIRERLQIWKFHVCGYNNSSNSISIDYSRPIDLLKTCFGHRSRINHVSWFHNSRFLLTSSLDGTARLHCFDDKIEQDFQAVTLAGHKSQVCASFFIPKQNIDLSNGGIGKPLNWEIWTVAERGTIYVYEWDENDLDEEIEEEKTGPVSHWSILKGSWVLKTKHDLYKSHAKIVSAAIQGYDPKNFVNYSNEKLQKYLRTAFGYLVVSYDSGTFSLYELNTMTTVQELSLSKYRINGLDLSRRGDWIALGCGDLGQIAVWEWRSETFVLKQQGHFYNIINCATFSPNGNLIVTVGDDNKVKVWSTRTGFSFVTFSEHEGPVTDVKFSNKGNVIITSSLDGTVRAFDLVRYRNFRIMTSPDENTQFSCCTIDNSSEIVCAGSNSLPRIYLWRLQTGKILVILNGHEAPVTSLSMFGSMLASCCLDKSVRLWNIYNSSSERIEVQAELLCIEYRSDGKQICCSGLNGNLYFFNTDTAIEEGVIEGRRDIVGGRKVKDRRSMKYNSAIHCFTSISYSADGKQILAGGRSKYVCLYHIASKVLLRKFQVSCNRSFDGILDKLNSKNLLANGAKEEMDVSDVDSDVEDFNQKYGWNFKGGDITEKIKMPEMRVKSVQFSPTNEQFILSSSEGLLIYTLDRGLSIENFDVSPDVTPTTVLELVKKNEIGKAFQVSLYLGEDELIKVMLEIIDSKIINSVVLAIKTKQLQQVLLCICDKLTKSPRIEFYTNWLESVLTTHSDIIKANSIEYVPIIRNIQEVLSEKHKKLARISEGSLGMLSFITD